MTVTKILVQMVVNEILMQMESGGDAEILGTRGSMDAQSDKLTLRYE